MDTEKKENIPVTTNNQVTKPLWPAHPIADMERALDRFFNRSWPTLWPRSEASFLDNMFEFEGMRLPSLDVIDRESDIMVRAEIPGIEKKDLSISLSDNQLSIKGQTSNEHKEQKGDYHRHEISSASFARSVTLPCAVDNNKTVAHLKDGILEITLPKMDTSKRKNIAVQ